MCEWMSVFGLLFPPVKLTPRFYISDQRVFSTRKIWGFQSNMAGRTPEHDLWMMCMQKNVDFRDDLPIWVDIGQTSWQLLVYIWLLVVERNHWIPFIRLSDLTRHGQNTVSKKLRWFPAKTTSWNLCCAISAAPESHCLSWHSASTL